MSGKDNKYELEVKLSGKLDESLKTAVRDAEKDIDKLERKIEVTVKKTEESVGEKREKAIKSLVQVSDKFFGTIAKGGALAAEKTTEFLKNSITAGMGFESQMSALQAVTKFSSSEMERLCSLTRKMGETTGFSAEEAGRELERMAMA